MPAGRGCSLRADEERVVADVAVFVAARLASDGSLGKAIM